MLTGLFAKGIALLVCLAVLVPTAGADAGSRTGQIVFSSNRSGAWRLWVIKADGSDLKQLGTNDNADEQDVDPMFSPDGQAVLFTSTRGGQAGVWRLALHSLQRERICDGDQAEWAPDGQRIAFRRQERIYVRNLSDGTEKAITPADWPHCSGPAWSPDGKSIALAARWDAGNGVYVVAAEGGFTDACRGGARRALSRLLRETNRPRDGSRPYSDSDYPKR